jgi:hypothetical protein
MARSALSRFDGVDNRQRETKGFQSTPQMVQAKRLAQQFLSRDQQQSRHAQAYGGSTGRTPPMQGAMGDSDTPQQLNAQVVNSLRTQDRFDRKSSFGEEQQSIKPGSPSKEFYRSLRS